MKSFKDREGREWIIDINVTAIKLVKSLIDFDLLDLGDGKVFEQLAEPVQLCDTLYCLCRKQAEERKISDEDFGRAMGGDVLDAASTALMEELVDFFHPRKRKVLAKALAKLKAVESRAIEIAEQMIDGTEMDDLINRALADYGSSFGSVPPCSASTPAPSLCAS